MLKFQPAPPCEGATRSGLPGKDAIQSSCFNPRPRARGRRRIRVAHRGGVINPAPVQRRPKTRSPCSFNPRPRARGRRRFRFASRAAGPQCFNPRPRARGRRRSVLDTCVPGRGEFQPAPPCEGATHTTMISPPHRVQVTVSTRAPVRGGDRVPQRHHRRRGRFNPRPRFRGRLYGDEAWNQFQPAPPCEGATP